MLGSEHRTRAARQLGRVVTGRMVRAGRPGTADGQPGAEGRGWDPGVGGNRVVRGSHAGGGFPKSEIFQAKRCTIAMAGEQERQEPGETGASDGGARCEAGTRWESRRASVFVHAAPAPDGCHVPPSEAGELGLPPPGRAAGLVRDMPPMRADEIETWAVSRIRPEGAGGCPREGELSGDPPRMRLGQGSAVGGHYGG